MPATKADNRPRRRVMGRPYIGPKVQTQLPPEAAKRIKEEAELRGVKEAVVLREYLLAALAF